MGYDVIIIFLPSEIHLLRRALSSVFNQSLSCAQVFLLCNPQKTREEARFSALGNVVSPFCVVLDVDMELPKTYVERALNILKREPTVGAVSMITHPRVRHADFGVSVWRSTVLKQIYPPKYPQPFVEKIDMYHYRAVDSYEECIHVWRALEKLGFRLEHLKHISDSSKV